MLCFDAEEKARGEVVDEVDTGRPVGLVIWRMLGQEVAMDEGNQPPDDSEDQPGEKEARGED